MGLDNKKPAHADEFGSNVDALLGESRIKIILEENEGIPPTGQYFGADGKSFILRPGEEAEVPVSILNILDTAIMSAAIMDGNGHVLGYRDKLRFPYRIVGARR